MGLTRIPLGQYMLASICMVPGTARALVKEHTSVRWHDLQLGVPALGTARDRLDDHIAHHYLRACASSKSRPVAGCG